MEYYFATGRRKRAIARVRIKEGTGKMTVNRVPIDDYFVNENYLRIIEEPFKVAKLDTKFDLFANIKGGGISGQVGALVLGIARALIKYDPELRKVLKPHGFLTRDPREVERKKYGLKKARKSFQWTKR